MTTQREPIESDRRAVGAVANKLAEPQLAAVNKQVAAIKLNILEEFKAKMVQAESLTEARKILEQEIEANRKAARQRA
jgi:hypothetical protein